MTTANPLDEVLSAALDLIKAACILTAGKPGPVRQRQTVSKTDGRYSYGTADVVVWTDFTPLALGNAAAGKAAERLGALLLEHPAIGRALLPRTYPNRMQPMGNERWMGWAVGSPLLNHYYATAQTGAFCATPAAQAVALIPAALKRTSAKRQLWAPLHGVEMPLSEFRLAEDTTIRALSDDEVAGIFFDPDVHAGPLGQADAMDLKAVVLHDYSVPLEDPLDTSHALKRVQALVTALRLMTGHGVRLFSWKDYSVDPFLDRGFMAMSPASADASTGPSVSLSGESLDSLRDVWVGVQQAAQNHPNLALALSRFDSAMTRAPSGDRLVDAWIALEALFTPDSNAEIAYRASIRIPAYLGGDADERLSRHKMVKDSYSLRSKIVHGVPAAATLRPEQTRLIDGTIDLLRRSLLRAVRDGALEAAAIDRSLLGAGASKEH